MIDGMSKRYSYASVPTIRQFARSPKFVRGLMGPFGSGKSSGCVAELMHIARAQHLVNGVRRSRLAIVRNTYPQLKDTSLKTFLEWFPQGVFGTYNKQDHVYSLQTEFNGELIESEILFRALDKPEHVTNLLSLELTAAWVNEAREIPWAIVKALMGRVDRYPAKDQGGAVKAGIILDTNPPEDDSWWFELFENFTTPGYEGDPQALREMVDLFKQPSGRSADAENLSNLSANYYSQLMLGASPDFLRVYIDGQYGYVKSGKPVYPEYNDDAHCSDKVEAVPKVTIVRGWDFGLTPACVFTQVLPDGRLIQFDELTDVDTSIDRFGDAVLELCEAKYAAYKFEDYGDPAGDSRSSTETDLKTCFDILKGKGIAIQPSEQGLTIRLESVKKVLGGMRSGRPQLQIHPRCKVTRKGFMGHYRYKERKITGAGVQYHDEPDKTPESHPHDALQYVAAKKFGAVVKSKEKSKNSDFELPMDELVRRAARRGGHKPYSWVV